jgi:hypothetical protein
MKTNVVAIAVATLTLLVFAVAPVSAKPERPPEVAIVERGAKIAAVTIETYGVVDAEAVQRYLSLRKGDTLEQSAVDRDYKNLTRLAGWRARLTVDRDPLTGEVLLHWIVMAKWLQPTAHPFYGDQPLSTPIEGVGWILTSPQLDHSGSTLSSYSQLAARADLVRAVYTKPLSIDALAGRETDLIVNTFGARGAYRASEPIAENVYSWFSGAEALYLIRGAQGTQIEFGIRESRSTSAKPTYITAPSLYDTYYAPARTTTLEAGISHGCPVPATLWHPPYCYTQYRVEAFDGIGGLGATSQYRTFIADMAQYTRVGSSTFVLHGAIYRTGGVVPTSALVCATGLRGYAKGTCGTDANVVQAEYRIADALPGNLKFIVFTEAASSRVRGGDQPFAPPTFDWRADSGVGVMYHGVRFDLASGSMGRRLTFELQGQLF